MIRLIWYSYRVRACHPAVRWGLSQKETVRESTIKMYCRTIWGTLTISWASCFLHHRVTARHTTNTVDTVLRTAVAAQVGYSVAIFRTTFALRGTWGPPLCPPRSPEAMHLPEVYPLFFKSGPMVSWRRHYYSQQRAYKKFLCGFGATIIILYFEISSRVPLLFIVSPRWIPCALLPQQVRLCQRLVWQETHLYRELTQLTLKHLLVVLWVVVAEVCLVAAVPFWIIWMSIT